MVAHLERELELTALQESNDLPMACYPIPSAIVPKKKAVCLKTVKNLRKKEKRKKYKMPKKANQLRIKHNPYVGLVARQTTMRNNVGNARVHISSLNAIGLKTHRKTIGIQKRKNHCISPHRPIPSPHQKTTIQKFNFATTPSQPTI